MEGNDAAGRTGANHPDAVFAYRVEHAGRSMVYATDTEHYACVDPRGLFGTPSEPLRVGRGVTTRMLGSPHRYPGFST